MRIADDPVFAELLADARLKILRYGDPAETNDDDPEAMRLMNEAIAKMDAYAASLHPSLQTHAGYQDARNQMTLAWICFSAMQEDDEAVALQTLDARERAYLASIDAV